MFKATKKDDFTIKMIAEIIETQSEMIRIHSSGDFYNYDYILKWLSIADSLPHVTFYAYTKSVRLFKKLKSIPKNFIVIYSYGGKDDHLIKKSDRHAKVFDDFIPEEYSYANDNDHIALAKNKKIGLLKH